MLTLAHPRLLTPARRLRLNRLHPLARNLVAAWFMEEGGGTKLYNVWEDGRHTGTLSGTILPFRSPWGPAMDLTGSRYYDVAHHADLDLTGDITLVALLRPTDAAANHIYCEKGNDVTGNVAYGWGSTTAGLWAFVHGSVFVATSASGPIVNVWQHLAMVRTVSNTTITYYVNGVKKDAPSYGATGPVSNTQTLGIGSRGNNAGGLFSEAQWAYVLLYKRALTPGEIQQFSFGLPFLVDEMPIIATAPVGPLLVVPLPATYRLISQAPAVQQSSLVLAPNRATLRLRATAPGVVSLEPFRKVQSFVDPGWTKQAVIPPLVLAPSGPAVMKVTAPAPTVLLTDPTFVQVASFTRSLTTVHGAFLDGDRIVWIVGRSGIGVELWRSDDRGVTWTFSTIGTWGGGDNIGTLSEPHLANFWLFNSSPQQLAQTPQSNPGAGGFTINPFAFSGSHHIIIGSGTFIYLKQLNAAQLYRRDAASEPPTSTLMGSTPGFDSNVYGKKIPGGDILVAGRDVFAVNVIHRVTPSPFAVVNNFQHGEPLESSEIGNPLAAITATDYWLGTVGIATGTMASVQSLNGGTSWTKRFAQTGFFSGMTNPEAAYLTAFARPVATDRAVATYYNPVDVTNHRKRFRLATFSTPEWIPAGPVTIDAGVVVMTVSGINVAGNTDVFVVTHEVAGNINRVYRLTTV